MEPTTILIPLALSFFAQTPAKPVPPAGDDFFVGAGQVIDRKPAVPKDAATWRREIARAQLLFEVDGKVQAARDDIMKTWDALMRSEKFDGRREVALETLDLGSRILIRLGEKEAVDVLFDARRQGNLALELVGIEKDQRFAYSRQSAAIGRGKATPDATQIDAAVLEALRAGNAGVLTELGTAAAPTFERLVRENPEEFKPIEADPLVYLMRCAPERASVLCRELLSRPGLGFLVAKRVMRAMENVKVPQLNPKPTILAWDSVVWLFSGDGQGWSDRPPTLLDPAWRDVVTLLLQIPVAASEALRLANQLAQFDALDAPLRAALLALAYSGDPSLVLALARSVGDVGQRSTVDPLLVDLLNVPSADVRVVAARELARAPRSEPLLAKITDPDPRVRIVIASALQPGPLLGPRYGQQSWARRPLDLERRLDDRDRPLLERLLADEDADVRTAALAVASKAGIRLSTEIADRLSKDPDAEVRRDVMRLLPTSANEAASFLERGLADPEPGVRNAASLELHERYGIFQRSNGIVSEPVAQTASPALRHLAIAQLVPGPAEVVTNGFRWPLVRRLLADPEDARALVKAFLAAPPNPNIAAQALWRGFLSSQRGEPGSLRFLDADSVRALVVRVHAEMPTIDKLIARLDETERTPDVQAGLAAFVADPAMSRSWRLSVWTFLVNDARAESLLFSALTEPPFDANAPDPNALSALGSLERRDDSNQVLSQTLARVFDAGVPDEIVASLANFAIQRGDTPDALSKRLLERLAKSTSSSAKNVRQWAVGREAEEGRWEPVRMALGESDMRTAALTALGRARPPQGLAWLGAYLHDPTWARRNGVAAAGAIAGYLSEEAAEILLRGAELAPTPEVRKACLEGVAEIRAFLEQKASWQQRTTGAQQRDAAVAELAGMLDSKDAAQRAEAARGLATLQGVEHLPRLVRMLQDPDAKVRAAVQESLERLNAPR